MTKRLAVATLMLWPIVAGAQHEHDAPEADRPAVLYDNLGSHRHAVTTSVAQAQKYFDQGLNLVFGFNHDESIRSFTEAARLDPKCAMAFWGVAYANGPHINNPALDPAHAEAAYQAIQQARALAPTGLEQEMIEALAKRYAADPKAERRPLDEAYAAAMRGVHQRHPGDTDAATLFAESMMDLRPWDFWTRDGQPQPGTEEIVSTLEAVLAKEPDHPGANHFLIHAVEASPHPEQAIAAADRLRTLVPGAGHLVHMPAHTYQRVGRYADAAEANRKAIAVDDQYVAKSGPQGSYLMYKAHNYQFLAASAMMDGRGAESVRAAQGMVAQVPPAMVVEMAGIMDGTWSLPLHAMVRFGRWDLVLAEPAPDAKLQASSALWHWARGMALVAKGRRKQAGAEAGKLQTALQALDEKAMTGFNPARTTVGIASDLLAAELARMGKDAAGEIAHLETAVAAEDTLNYDEPADWPLPIRHYLGAALLRQGKVAAAEAVYRRDLEKNPENGWALFGLHECLKRKGPSEEAAQVDSRWRAAWARSDVVLKASRF